MFKTKKAAMFGLDARVALAIFGALSIITGATLYNALQHIKTVKHYQFFTELVKAYEAYYLDNGKSLPQFSTATLYISDLSENRESLKTWKGPYIDSIQKAGLHYSFVPESVLGVNLLGVFCLYTVSNWPVVNDPVGCNINDSDCAMWAVVETDTSEKAEFLNNVFIKLDKYIDNNDGPSKGKIRKVEITSEIHRLFFQGIPHKRKF
ncbi:MAG: type II secretion system protein [Proteobacteria bacterium]|nr:type II secretion system protein [Pseudomonadota bacterium]